MDLIEFEQESPKPLKLQVEKPIVLIISECENDRVSVVQSIVHDLGQGNLDSFKPMPQDFQEVDEEGTRTLRLEGDHNTIVTLSGGALVTKRKESNVIILKHPKYDTPAGKRFGGHTIVDKNGDIYNVYTEKPIGAYKAENEKRKAKNTRKYGGFFGTRVIGRGVHSERPDVGWNIYEIPGDAIPPHILFSTDKQLFYHAIEKLAEAARRIHEGDLDGNLPPSAHMEMHLGNWFYSESIKGEIVLTDWSTVVELDDLPDVPQSGKKIEMFDELDRKQKVKCLDMFASLQEAVVTLHERDLLAPDMQILAETTVRFVSGYTGHEYETYHVARFGAAAEKIAKKIYEEDPLPGVSFSHESMIRLWRLAWGEVCARSTLELAKNPNHSIDELIHAVENHEEYVWYGVDVGAD